MSKRKKFIVCVSAQVRSEHIVRAARAMADEAGASLSIVSVMSDGDTEVDPFAISRLQELAHRYDAEMTVLYSDEPVLAVVDYINYYKINRVIVGSPTRRSQGDFVPLLREVLPKVDVTLIPPSVLYQQDNTSIVALWCNSLYHPIKE